MFQGQLVTYTLSPFRPSTFLLVFIPVNIKLVADRGVNCAIDCSIRNLSGRIENIRVQVWWVGTRTCLPHMPKKSTSVVFECYPIFKILKLQ